MVHKGREEQTGGGKGIETGGADTADGDQNLGFGRVEADAKWTKGQEGGGKRAGGPRQGLRGRSNLTEGKT